MANSPPTWRSNKPLVATALPSTLGKYGKYNVALTAQIENRTPCHEHTKEQGHPQWGKLGESLLVDWLQCIAATLHHLR